MSIARKNIEHYGPSPYRLVGTEYRGRTRLGTMTGSECDLCFTAIHNIYHVECGNGVTIKCGCDCAKSITCPEFQRQVTLEKRKHDKALRAARKAVKEEAGRVVAKAQLEAYESRLRNGMGYFYHSCLKQLRAGKPLSPKQVEALGIEPLKV